jgi:uncharacterized membrane protein
MEARYPPAPIFVRFFIVLYPVFLTALMVLLSNNAWLWALAAICGIAWFGAVSVFLANAFRREGYLAAMDDLTGGDV